MFRILPILTVLFLVQPLCLADEIDDRAKELISEAMRDWSPTTEPFVIPQNPDPVSTYPSIIKKIIEFNQQSEMGAAAVAIGIEQNLSHGDMSEPHQIKGIHLLIAISGLPFASESCISTMVVFLSRSKYPDVRALALEGLSRYLEIIDIRDTGFNLRPSIDFFNDAYLHEPDAMVQKKIAGHLINAYRITPTEVGRLSGEPSVTGRLFAGFGWLVSVAQSCGKLIHGGRNPARSFAKDL